MAQFDGIENESGLEKRYDSGPERLADLLQAMHREAEQRVAALVDEYHKPSLDALEVE